MRVLLWGLAGLVLGAVLAFGIGITLPEIFTISQREGAYAMGVLFFWTPAGAVLGAIAGGIWALMRR